MSEKVEGGKLVGGVWMPETEKHLTHMLMTDPKAHRIVDGLATYQYKKLEACLRHQPPDRRRVAVDIGAHVGLWSMWLVKHFEFVEAFEPVPLHCTLFEKNVKGSQHNLHAYALGSYDGLVDINVPLGTTGSAHVAINKTRHPGFTFENKPGVGVVCKGVEIYRLDNFCLTEVDFIKIDVEGLEKSVLLGAEETIRGNKPNIIVEQKGNDAAYGDEKEAAVHLLKKWGMKQIEVISGDWIMGWS